MGNVSDYRPSRATLERLKHVHFVAMVGPTAAGKTTLITAARARDPELHLILSDTTRAPRPEEREGIDYHFRSREEITAGLSRQEYVNLAPSLNGIDIYAMHPDSLPDSGIGTMALLAEVVPEFRALPFASFKAVFTLSSDFDVWWARIKTHNFTPEQKAKRLSEAMRSLSFARDDPEVLFVVNDDLETATADFIRIIHDQPLSSREQQNQERGPLLAASFIKRLTPLLR